MTRLPGKDLTFFAEVIDSLDLGGVQWPDRADRADRADRPGRPDGTDGTDGTDGADGADWKGTPGRKDGAGFSGNPVKICQVFGTAHAPSPTGTAGPPEDRCHASGIGVDCAV